MYTTVVLLLLLFLLVSRLLFFFLNYFRLIDQHILYAIQYYSIMNKEMELSMIETLYFHCCIHCSAS